MKSFVTSLIICSAGISLAGFFYMILQPLFRKHYSSKAMYYAWLPVLLALLIPFRIQVENPPLQNLIAKITLVYEISIEEQTARQQKKLETQGQKNSANTTINKIDPVLNAAVSDENALHFLPENSNPVSAPLVKDKPVFINWWQVAFALWIIGAAAVMGYAFYKHIRFKAALKRWREKVTDPLYLTVFENIKKEMTITKSIGLYTCSFAGSPMMGGIKNPTILLPDERIDEEEIYLILKHELVHFKRKDLWYKVLVLLASAIHWFNPLMILIAKNINILCEISCDDQVVRNADEAMRLKYSETIIGLMKNSGSLGTQLSTSFNGGKKGMKKRLLSIMDTGKKKIGFLLVAFVLVLTLAAGFAVAAQKEPDKTETKQAEEVNKSNSLREEWDKEIYWKVVNKVIENNGWEDLESYYIQIDDYVQETKTFNRNIATLRKGAGEDFERKGVFIILRMDTEDKLRTYGGPFESEEEIILDLPIFLQNEIKSGNIDQEEIDSILKNYREPITSFNSYKIWKQQANSQWFDENNGEEYTLESFYYNQKEVSLRSIDSAERQNQSDNAQKAKGYELYINYATGTFGYAGPYNNMDELVLSAKSLLEKAEEEGKLTAEEADAILKGLNDNTQDNAEKESLYWEYDSQLLEEKIAEKGWDKVDGYEVAIDVYDQTQKTMNKNNTESTVYKIEKGFGYVEKKGVIVEIRPEHGERKMFGPFETREELFEDISPYLKEQVTKGTMAQSEADLIINQYKEYVLTFDSNNVRMKNQVNMAFFEDKTETENHYYIESQKYYQNIGFHYRHVITIGSSVEKMQKNPSKTDGYDLVIYFKPPEEATGIEAYQTSDQGYLGPYETKEELLVNAALYLQELAAKGKITQQEADEILSALKKEKTANDKLVEELGKENFAWMDENLENNKKYTVKEYRYNQLEALVEKNDIEIVYNGNNKEAEPVEGYAGYKMIMEFSDGNEGVVGPYITMEEFLGKTSFYLQELVHQGKISQEEMIMVLSEITKK